jgi:hypothetical protein
LKRASLHPIFGGGKFTTLFEQNNWWKLAKNWNKTYNMQYSPQSPVSVIFANTYLAVAASYWYGGSLLDIPRS